MSYFIRTARLEDAERLREIYSYYVTDTAISFEYEVPTVEEFRERIRKTLEKYPYLVVEVEGRIAGYCYASAFKGRPAYDWSVETTIYLDRNYKKMGLGRLLYEALEEALKKMNILNANACIAVCDVADEHINNNSKEFHEHMGYSLVGTFHNSGFKFHNWYDMIWMEKFLGEHTNSPKKVQRFC